MWAPRGVHVTRHHGLSGDVEDPGALGGVEIRSHGGDPVVFHEHVAAGDDLLAVHGEHLRRVLQQDPAAGTRPRLGHHRVEGVRCEILVAPDRRRVLTVDGVPERPDHRVARGRPGQVVTALGRHFPHRDRVLAAPDLDLEGVLPEAWDLDQVVAVLQLEERPVAGGGEHDLARGRRVRSRATAGDLEVGLPVAAVELERIEPGARSGEIDPIRVVREVGEASSLGRTDDAQVTARSRDEQQFGEFGRPHAPDFVLIGVEIGLPRAFPQEGVEMLLDRRAPDHDGVSRGIPGGFGVEGGVRGQRRARAAGRGDRLEVAAGARPGDVGDPVPFRRPGGHELVLVGIGQPGRGSARQVHPVEAAERREDDRAPVRRDARPADDPGGDRRPVVHAAGKVEARRHLRLHLRLEGDGGHGAGLEVDPAETAVHGGDQRRAVRREGVAGHRVPAGPGFLVVAGDPVGQPALLAGLEVAHPQRGPRAVAGGVHQVPSVRMQQRAHRASRGAGDGRLFAGLAVEAHHLPDRELRVVVEGPAPLGDIDVAAVRRGDGPETVRRLRAGHAGGRLGGLVAEPDPGPAVPVDQEHGGGPLGRPGLRYEEILPVRGPARRDHELRPVPGRAVLGDGARFASVGVRDPEVLDPVPVAHERDLAPVGGEDRLALERDVSHDPGRGTPRDRQGVEIAEQLEDDRLAVRRDVEGHPGALGDGEGQGVAGGQRQTFVLFFGVRIVLQGGAGWGQQKEASQERQHRQQTESHAHYLRPRV